MDEHTSFGIFNLIMICPITGTGKKSLLSSDKGDFFMISVPCGADDISDAMISF